MEGTQVETQKTDAQIAESWATAEKAPEPGDSLKEGSIKVAGMPEGLGMRYQSLESAGWVYVYHQETGDRSRINRNMLGMQLRKKLPDGRNAFSIYPPKDAKGNIIKPARGTIKCMLHKDDPNRENYTRWGFPVCPCDNLKSEHDKIQHMKHRHGREWETIDKDRQDREKQEDRKFQQMLYTKMTESIKPAEIPQQIVVSAETTSKVSPQPTEQVLQPAKATAEVIPQEDTLRARRVAQMAKAREAKKAKQK